MIHAFDTDIAVEFGVNEAIILNHLFFWISKNEADGVNYHDGAFWTFSSTRALSTHFPYLSQKQIQTALRHLKDADIIKTGNYNTVAYDHTTWYRFTEKGKSIMTKSKIESDKKSNRSYQNVKPIPDNTTDNTTDIYMGASPDLPAKKGKRQFVKPTVEEVKAYCAERGNNVNAEQFIDYYEARGWELTKGRKMVDWKAAVRTWERNGYNKPKKGPNGVELKEDYDHSIDDLL